MAINPRPHQINESKNQLSRVVFETSEALTRLYIRDDWADETHAHLHHMLAYLHVEVRWYAPTNLLQEYRDLVDGVRVIATMMCKFRFEGFCQFFTFMCKAVLCL